MLEKTLKDYAAALAANDRVRTLGIIAGALSAGVRPEDLVAAAFITPGELASTQARYLKGEFERGRFFLELYEKATDLDDAAFMKFAVEGAAALIGSPAGRLRVLSGNCTGDFPPGDPGWPGALAACADSLRAEVRNIPDSVCGRSVCVPVRDEKGSPALILCVCGKDADYDDYDLLQMQLTANEMHKTLCRRAAMAEERRRLERTFRAQAALLGLAKSDFPDLQSALKEILETVSETLGAARVSFWSFSADRSEIVCEDLCSGRGRPHVSGARLRAADYPAYFRALEEGLVIAADDAEADARTREFTHGYLRPHGIASMMDVPVWRRGKMAGLICNEHTGAVRRWYPEEQSFAISVADQLSALMEALERRKAESGLRESEARWKFLLEGVQVIGPDWRYRYLNRTAAEHGRLPAERLVGRTMMEAYPGIEKSAMFALLRECMEKRIPQRMENEFIFENGTSGWFDLRMEPYTDGVIILSYDITAQKRTEAALQESRHWLVLAQETARLGNWELDVATGRMQCSPAAGAIFGLDPQGLGGRFEDLLRAVHPEDRLLVEDTYRKAVRDRLGGYELEHRMAAGGKRVRQKCYLLRDRLGKPARAIGMVMDLGPR